MKKEMIKSVVKITLILLLAVGATYYIYYKFQGEGSVDFKSASLDVTYHDSDADKIKITKVTPVTDSVGLSSNSYTVSVKNNLTMAVNYKIKVVQDSDEIKNDECGESLIPLEDIRISVKNGKSSNELYTLSELEDGVLLSSSLDALESTDVVVRIWVSRETALTPGAKMHFHGLIQVIEEDETLAINK